MTEAEDHERKKRRIPPSERYSLELDPVDAERINEHYDVELYFGAHGVDIHAPGLQSNPDLREMLSTKLEFEAVAKVVAGLQPGDILFIENFGFIEQPASLAAVASNRSEIARFMQGGGNIPPEMSALMQFMGNAMMSEFIRAADQKKVNKVTALRDSNEIDAWEYAELLAGVKRVQIQYADYNAEDAAAIEEEHGKTLAELYATAEGLPLAWRIRDERDTASSSIIKDWLVGHLPPEGTLPPKGRKPKVVLLDGFNHEAQVSANFEEMRIKAKVIQLERSTVAARRAEHGLPPEPLNPALSAIMRKRYEHVPDFKAKRMQERTGSPIERGATGSMSALLRKRRGALGRSSLLRPPQVDDKE